MKKKFVFLLILSLYIVFLRYANADNDNYVYLILSWNATNADLDLRLVNPDGDVCYWKNSKTNWGAVLDYDSWGGRRLTDTIPYEEHITLSINGILEHPGKYRIEVAYYEWSDGNNPENVPGYLDVFINNQFVERIQFTISPGETRTLWEDWISASNNMDSVIQSYPGDAIKLNYSGEMLDYKLIFYPSSYYQENRYPVVGVLLVFLNQNHSVYDKAYYIFSPYILGIYRSFLIAYSHDQKDFNLNKFLEKVFKFLEDGNRSIAVPIHLKDLLPVVQKGYNYVCFYPVYLKKEGWWSWSKYKIEIGEVSSENMILLVDKNFFAGIILTDFGALFMRESGSYIDSLIEIKTNTFFNSFIKPKYKDLLLDLTVNSINEYVSLVFDYYQDFSAIRSYFRYINLLHNMIVLNEYDLQNGLNLTSSSRDVRDSLKEYLKTSDSSKLRRSVIDLSKKFDKLYAKICTSFTNESWSNDNICNIEYYLYLTMPFNILYYYDDNKILSNTSSWLKRKAINCYISKNDWNVISF